MHPSPKEIAFARQRRRLSDELAPYFLERIQAADFPAFDIDGDIDTLGGGPPRENTIYGQSFIFRARIHPTGSESHELQLLIQHTEEWYPAVTVLSDDGGPQQTIVIRDDLEGAIQSLKQLIDAAIEKICNA